MISEPKTQFARRRRWRARWIWSDAEGHEQNVYYYFRKVVDLQAEPTGHRIFISADTRYQLFINGRFVGRGVPQSQPFYQYYDEYDVSGDLQKGENCIAVIVNHVGNLDDTRGGLLLEVVDGAGAAVASTAETWRVLRSAAWWQDTYFVRMNKATPYQEFFDARKEPVGWRDAGFDDAAWRAAQVVGGRTSDRPPCAGPWTRLVRRDIPLMTNDPVSAVRIECVEESVEINNRSRVKDLAPGLSVVGKPLQYSRLEAPENLCRPAGVTVVQGSLNHLDLDFDGLYTPAVVLDFGRVITARARLHLEGAAGGHVDIGYAERLIDGRFNIALECEFADRYYMKDGDQVFESFTWKSFRYLKLRFRYCAAPVTVHSVQGVVTTYPYEERGRFSSDDAGLNAVFDICRATVRLCSNEFLMDTPWREQAQWLGDVALVTVPAIQSCFGDTALTRKFLMQAGQNQHPTGMISNVSNTVNHAWQRAIPDYSLWWIHGLLGQWMYEGDEELIHRLYPQALRVLDAHLDCLNADSLIEDMPYWIFIDWADVERSGICSAYNAIFYATLGSLHKLATFKGDAYTAQLAQDLRASMKAAFHDTLFDAARGCYADACVDGVLSPKISEHGNMAPIWAGLCDGDVAARVISQVFESDGAPTFTEAQPFFMAVVLAALDGAGRFDLALDLIRRRWGKRMVAKGATSVYEEWYQNGSWREGFFGGFMRTHSHAWSACPADFLIRAVLGLEILEPGCRRIRVSPRKTAFDYQVVFPTPLGLVTGECTGGEVKVSADAKIEMEMGP
jgi:alpha-L-rhamnosidase